MNYKQKQLEWKERDLSFLYELHKSSNIKLSELAIKFNMTIDQARRMRNNLIKKYNLSAKVIAQTL